jgi:hypothetical protein
LGSGFLYGLAATFGVSAYNLHDLSLFSPFHLYRFLALALSGDVVCPTMGQIWGDPDRMHMIMELYVDWVGLLGPLITYGIIALFAFILSVRIFMSHHSFWVYESRYTESWTGAEKGILELPEDHIPSREDNRNRKILKRHRQIVAAFILVLIIGGPILMLSYARQRQSELTYVLYENSGKVIVLGEYYYGEVDVPEPPLGMNNMYQLETIILDWSNCPEPLDRWSGFREMTLDEFTALNVSEREDLVSSGSHSITHDDASTGGGWHGFSWHDSGIFVWFFKYNCTEQSACSITVSIKVSVQSM